MPETRLAVRPILLAALGLAGGIAAAIGVVVIVLRLQGLPLGGPAVVRPVPIAGSSSDPTTLATTVPTLQAAPQPDLANYRAEEARELDQLAWTDASRTKAQVPIRVAMAMMVARSASAVASASTSTSTSLPGPATREPSPAAAPDTTASPSVPPAAPVAPVTPRGAAPSASAPAIESPASRAQQKEKEAAR